MCLIIHKPKNKRIPSDILRRAKEINPHGFGLTYLDNGKTQRSMNYKRVNALVDTDRPLVCHFRFATVGVINASNCHPFKIGDKHLIYSNGTVKGFGNDKQSDIACIANDVLSYVSPDLWKPFLELTETRFAIVGNGQVQRIGAWHEKGGIYYSKSNCFYDSKPTPTGWGGWYDSLQSGSPYSAKSGKSYQKGSPQKHRVGVYGTLKQGYSNHRLLAKADFVGDACTFNDYPLVVDGLPYLYEEEGHGKQVALELYDCTDKELEALDRLEGHPTFYARKEIEVIGDNGVETAWVYFIQSDLEEGFELLESYEGVNSRYEEPIPSFTF